MALFVFLPPGYVFLVLFHVVLCQMVDLVAVVVCFATEPPPLGSNGLARSPSCFAGFHAWLYSGHAGRSVALLLLKASRPPAWSGLSEWSRVSAAEIKKNHLILEIENSQADIDPASGWQTKRWWNQRINEDDGAISATVTWCCRVTLEPLWWLMAPVEPCCWRQEGF